MLSVFEMPMSSFHRLRVKFGWLILSGGLLLCLEKLSTYLL
jgi:hypothetical protein